MKSTVLFGLAAAAVLPAESSGFTFPTECTVNKKYREASGTVDYPSGSRKYKNNIHACFYFKCRSKRTVLRWTEFETESGFDIVSAFPVTDGIIGSTAVLSHSGESIPEDTVVDQDGIFVQLTSDFSERRSGFVLNWTCSEPPTATPTLTLPTVTLPTAPESPPTPPASPPTSTCATPRVRKAWSLLSCAERDLYISAVGTFHRTRKADFDRMVEMHLEAGSYAHGTSAFLAWHRYYLVGWENMLRSLGGEFSCIAVPYWDWEKDAGSESQSVVFSASTFGSASGIDSSDCVNDGVANFNSGTGWRDSRNMCLRRTYAFNWGFTGQAAMAAVIQDFPNFVGFRPTLEGSPHGAPHVAIGGQMSTFYSPEDPLFMVHHANVDRMYALWQDYHGHDEVAKADLNGNHYAVAGSPSQEALLQLDSVLPMTYDGTSTLQWFSAAWTIRDVHHTVGMPGANGENDFVYGDDNLAGILGTPLGGSGWNWVSPVSGAATVNCPASASASTERAAVSQAAVAAKNKEQGEQKDNRCAFADHVMGEICLSKVALEPAIESVDLLNYLAKIECDKTNKEAVSQEWIDLMRIPKEKLKYTKPCWYLDPAQK